MGHGVLSLVPHPGLSGPDPSVGPGEDAAVGAPLHPPGSAGPLGGSGGARVKPHIRLSTVGLVLGPAPGRPPVGTVGYLLLNQVRWQRITPATWSPAQKGRRETGGVTRVLASHPRPGQHIRLTEFKKNDGNMS